MALQIGERKTFGTLFQVEDKGTYVQANLSTSRKNREGEYTNMSWRARFVGDAAEKARGLEDKTRITIHSGLVENDYNKETGKLYVTVVVFDFDVYTPEA